MVGNFRINMEHELAAVVPHPTRPQASIRPLRVFRDPEPNCTVRTAALKLSTVYLTRWVREVHPEIQARAAAIGAATIVLDRRGPTALRFLSPRTDLPELLLPSGDICIGNVIRAKPSYEQEVGHPVVAGCSRRCDADGNFRGCGYFYPLSEITALRVQFFASTDAEIDLERLDRAVRAVLSTFIQRVDN